MKLKMKRVFGILLSFALMLTMMPVLSQTAFAGVAPPYAQYKNTTTVIKFDDKDWYLIDYDSSTVTLLSKECVGASAYNESGSFVEYASSTVKTAVDNWYNDNNNITADAKTAVSGGAMFLLTNTQANTIHSANPDVLKCSQASGTAYNRWWLCSQGLNNKMAAFLDGETGDVSNFGNGVGSTFGVRPALQLDLSKVVFDSTSKTFSIFKSYPLWVGGTQVTSANMNDVLVNDPVNAGKVSYTPASDGAPAKLTLNGARITKGLKDNYSNEYGIYYNGSEPLNIDLADGSVNNVEIAGFGAGICVDAPYYALSGLNISGKGQLTASGSDYGIQVNGNIKVEGCDVTASGGSGIHSYGSSIEIKGGSVNASATNYNAISAGLDVTIDGASVEASATGDSSIGILSYDSNVIIKAGSIVTASGEFKAISCEDGMVKNAIAGTGWTNVEGTEGKTAIEVKEEGQTLDEKIKKVQFPAMFTVTFVDGQGKTLGIDEVASGKAAIAPADPTRDGYTFKGWDKDFSNVTEDMTVTALWEKKADPTPTPTPTPTKVSGTEMTKMSAGKTSITMTWNKIQGADGYDIFFAKCNSKDKTYKSRRVKTIRGNNIFKWTKSGLKKGTPYKALVKAYVMKDGKKSYVGTSPLMHAYTGNGTKKFTNAKAVKVNKTKITLNEGGAFKVKAKVLKVKKNKKLMPKSHVATVRFVSTDKKIATVTKSGKIRAKGKGTCTVIAFAHNGVAKKITVTVE